MVVPRNVAGVQDTGGPEDWFHSLPVITKYWFALTVICTVSANLGLINPASLIFDWPSFRYKFEIWRIITPFCFMGAFSFQTLIGMYQLVTYSQRYEVGGPYNTGAGGGTADYAFMLMLCATTVLLVQIFVFGRPMLLAGSLSFAVLYVWSKREPTAQVAIFGFPLKAQMLPFALTALNLCMANPIIDCLVGIGVGHVYYFVAEIIPALYGKDILHTPDFLVEYFGTGVYIPPVPTAAQQRYPGPGRVNPPSGGARPVGGGGYNWGSGQTLGSS
mmetsp:Transcript_14247/g.21934  ORF Transcript_14247/g.21934 Transcript_14247/m.21934 type:complete len:274 (-) Transcript_14247:403-1224(-)|eukprot:CAMPEP_0196825756 /NCGR_PEP_ID=MMETSP1362-20130617/93241_1 /TAXON_ID=163516 /ORGANISM="Leptocylindrus danicus, Strain CCMP1856" /LENGTH=273 /DNA_ID=CAMNT_0042206241 /DNA_START=494 /DNA_END=1315 /DNA_ORIENTATION=+